VHVDDLDAMSAVYADPDVTQWVADGQPLTRQQCEEWIEVTHRNYQLRGYGMFLLELKSTGQVAGFCGLVHPAGQVEPEIKYALHRSMWGQGLASEAASALLAYGARAHGLSLVIATVAPEHKASHRVLLKAGMQLGPLRENDDGSQTQLFSWRPAAENAA
jgi:RimJ/RimL family protein N-acetyltransferase